MSRQDEIAVDIINIFEDLLEEHGILIPDDDRTGSPSEAPIFGVTYGDLQDKIVSILTAEGNGVK